MAVAANRNAGPTPALYVLVTIVLLALLALTVVLAQLELGGFWHPVTAYAIASAKALLIILYFMQIRYSNKVLWLVAAAGFFWMAILITLSLSDFLTREWIYR